MIFHALMLALFGSFLVVGAIAAVAQAAGGPVFFTAPAAFSYRPRHLAHTRLAVAWS